MLKFIINVRAANLEREKPTLLEFVIVTQFGCVFLPYQFLMFNILFRITQETPTTSINISNKNIS